jgi:hypothetical protein
MLESFRLGGIGMIPTAFFGVLLVGAALRYASKPEARWIPLQVALAVLTLAMGGLGFVMGLVKTTTNLGGLQPPIAVKIAAIGFGESLCNVGLALALLTLAAMAACVGAARKTASTHAT